MFYIMIGSKRVLLWRDNTEIEIELEEINNELRKILSNDKSLKIKPSYLLNLANNLSKLY